MDVKNLEGFRIGCYWYQIASLIMIVSNPHCIWKPNLVEKGFFHLFGELYLDGINSLRTGPPDRSECVLSMGRIAGQHLCPEQENFQKLESTKCPANILSTYHMSHMVCHIWYVTYGMWHAPFKNFRLNTKSEFENSNSTFYRHLFC